MLQVVVLFVGLVSLGLTNGQYFGDYHCEGGRDVFVHLFEWGWNDIASECENHLAGMGYCGIQVSPPQEHIIITNPWHPWWTRYQPVSYILNSRSGNENQFRDMVTRCNNAGVRIYVDAIINHMTGGGQGTGTAGSSWNGNTESYPAVPYSVWDFHGSDVCHTWNMEISNYNNADEVRYCRLVGLRDLRHDNNYVRDMVAQYMNTLIGIGVAGFRIDAAKHMFPHWISNVANRLNNLNTQWFPGGTRPFIFSEVIDLGGEAIKSTEYLYFGRSTEFKYSAELGACVKGANGQRMAYLNNFGEGWGFISGLSAVVFTDNHDNQRGHGAGGANVLTYHNAKQYKVGNAYMLAWPYGYPKVMSSYNFNQNNGDQGPPVDGNGNLNSVACFNGDWVCEHRWRQIYNMVKFHNAVLGTAVLNWWDNGNQRIAFSRGNRGFIVINNQSGDLQRDFNTGLPDGQYCDVITCENNRPPCGSTSDGCREVTVSGGWANIWVPNDDNPIVAIHV